MNENRSIRQMLWRLKSCLLDVGKALSSERERILWRHKNWHPSLIAGPKPSTVAISVVIPTAEKDVSTLPLCIEGIRKNVLHPLDKIVIISQTSPTMRAACEKLGCELVDENSIVDFKSLALEVVVNGRDRSKWIYQQFLKWSGEAVCDTEHYLVVDSDTVLVSPQVYLEGTKTVMNFADEYHRPYFDILERLLGFKPRLPVSLTSHQMLFSVSKLRDVKARIEQLSGKPWTAAIVDALDRSQASGHSDYETYGQYLYRFHRSSFRLRYWFNVSIEGHEIPTYESLRAAYGSRYKSVSYHSYNRV